MSRGLWESLFGPGVQLAAAGGVGPFGDRLLPPGGAADRGPQGAQVLSRWPSPAWCWSWPSEGWLARPTSIPGTPASLGKTGLWIWQKVTGQEALPGIDAGGDMDAEYRRPAGGEQRARRVPHRRRSGWKRATCPWTDSLRKATVPVSGDVQMEEGDVPPSEGDFQDNIDFSRGRFRRDRRLHERRAGGGPIPPLGELFEVLRRDGRVTQNHNGGANPCGFAPPDHPQSPRSGFHRFRRPVSRESYFYPRCAHRGVEILP